MLNIDSCFWIGFSIAVLLINISPGPEMVYVVSNTIAQGRRHGIASSLGTATGSTVHVVLVACGLAIVLSASLVAFTIIKTAGAVYLVYLGVRAILSGSDSIDIGKVSENKRSVWGAYQKGIFVGLLNPKSIIFFLSFLPQFVRTDRGEYSFQILYLGFITVLAGVLVELILIILIRRLADMLLKKKFVTMLVDKAMGTLLVYLGIRLALSTERS
ncbi:MAG: LysE family translocator [Treponema sp.]|jgi:threonine/homoserine/homoserine lactone efflux protein|nr:LysE family translocator [Treponema sp.]